MPTYSQDLVHRSDFTLIQRYFPSIVPLILHARSCRSIRALQDFSITSTYHVIMFGFPITGWSRDILLILHNFRLLVSAFVRSCPNATTKTTTWILILVLRKRRHHVLLATHPYAWMCVMPGSCFIRHTPVRVDVCHARMCALPIKR